METVKLFEIKKNNTDLKSVNIKSSKDCEKFIRQFYGDDIEVYESFFILLLNRANDTIGYAKISQGGIVGTIVDVKIIAKYVVDSLASGIILAHNHPSGNLLESKSDIDITNKIKNVLSYFDCKVLDHLILTKQNYYSFADNNIL
jgi:DNA repair protein RadC